MKYCLFIFFFIRAQFAFTQGYISLPDSNATWKLDYMDSPIQCPPAGYCYSINLNILNDTLIGSYAYHLTDYSSPTNFIPAFRQDTANKKIYFPLIIGPGITADTLLFDFNLQVGNSILQVVAGTFNNQSFQVIQIDSVFNGLIYLKRWLLSGGGQIIEGVGNILGLFGEFNFFEQSFGVNCMIKNGQSFYPNLNTNCSLVGIEQVNDVNLYFTVVPNPVSRNQSIEIKCSQITHTILSLELISLLGKKAILYINPENIVNLYNVLPGFYILQVQFSNGIRTERYLVIY